MCEEKAESYTLFVINHTGQSQLNGWNIKKLSAQLVLLVVQTVFAWRYIYMSCIDLRQSLSVLFGKQI